MISMLTKTKEEAVKAWHLYTRADRGWKIFSCEVNGELVYGVAYSRRDFLNRVVRQYVLEMAEVDTSDLELPVLKATNPHQRKVAQKPRPVLLPEGWDEDGENGKKKK